MSLDDLSDAHRSFLDVPRSGAMITLGADGYAKAVRVGVAPVNGRLWSSGTESRIRTTHLRRDPRSTLFLFDDAYAYLTLETTVTILAGPDVPQQSIELFRVMQNKPSGPLSWFGGELDEDQFARTMIDEGRVIYEFEVHKAYGLT